MKNSQEIILKTLLVNELDILQKAKNYLIFTYTKCKMIDLHSDMTPEEFELLDSLSSRFIRLYEIYIKQVLRTILQIVGEYENTFIDNLNKSEKLGLIKSRALAEETRIIKNIIAHEYQEEEWPKIYENLMQIIPDFLASMKQTQDYLKSRRDIFYI